MLQNRPKSPGDGQGRAPTTLLPGVEDAQIPQLQTPPQPPSLFARFLPRWAAGAVQPVLVVMAFLFVLEVFAPESFKPSTYVGGFAGHTEATELRTALKAKQATLAAMNEENVRLQNQVQDFKSRTERVTAAYTTLYGRATIMAQAMADVQKNYLALRQQTVASTQSGNVTIAQLSPWVTLYGLLTNNKDMAQAGTAAGQQATNQVTSAMDQAFRDGVQNSASALTAWQDGLPDVQQFRGMLAGNTGGPQPPEQHAPAPPPPAAYQPTPPPASSGSQ